jgi:hypothetical protein
MALENDDRATSEGGFDRWQGPDDQSDLVLSSLSEAARNRITEGELASRRASRVPKSVSAGTTRRDSAAARSKTVIGGSMHAVVENVDGVMPTNRIGHFGMTGVPDSAFQACLVPNLVPNRPGNRLRCRRHRVRDPVQQIDPAPPTARDPARVVPERRRRIRAAELGAHVGDRRTRGQRLAREGVPEVVEPERGQLGPREGSLECLADSRLVVRSGPPKRRLSIGSAGSVREALLRTTGPLPIATSRRRWRWPLTSRSFI